MRNINRSGLHTCCSQMMRNLAPSNTKQFFCLFSDVLQCPEEHHSISHQTGLANCAVRQSQSSWRRVILWLAVTLSNKQLRTAGMHLLFEWVLPSFHICNFWASPVYPTCRSTFICRFYYLYIKFHFCVSLVPSVFPSFSLGLIFIDISQLLAILSKRPAAMIRKD